MTTLGIMSWRRFHVLVKGLSPQSATVTRISSSQYIGGSRNREPVNEVVGPKAAQQAFDALFRPARSALPPG